MPYTGPEPARRPLSSDDITDGIVSTADLADSAVTTAKITNNAVTAAKVSADVAQLGKSILINGSMTVAQRGTQTGQGDTGAYTAVDRYVWRVEGSTQGRVTTSQDTDVPSGEDFSFSLKVDCTTAESAVAADEAIVLQQRIEAQNLQHLRYGDASAKTVMVSFWVKSPKSGTHCVGLYSQDGNRHYVKEYTVGAADTWEYKTVTFPGDASGTINNDTGRGLDISWPLVAGGNHQVTADTWASGEDWATGNQQNLLDNTANNFYITGIQLEVGSVATDFEHEPYSATLAKCQRYFYRQNVSNQRLFFGGYDTSSGNGVGGLIPFPVNMRTAPTASSTGTYSIVRGGALVTTGVSVTPVYISSQSFAPSWTSSGNIAQDNWYGADAGAGVYIDFTAEL